MDHPNLPKFPKWLRDITQLLPIRAQFILTGNIRDKVLICPASEPPRMISPVAALWEVLEPLGYRGMLIWDAVEGIRAYPADPSRLEFLNTFAGVNVSHPQLMGVGPLAEVVQRVTRPATRQQDGVALLIDFSSRLRDEGQTPPNVKDLFLAAEKAALEAEPVARSRESGLGRMFNPVFWLANRPNDLPYWLTVDNERVRAIPVPLPDAETRQRAAQAQWQRLPNKDVDAPSFAKVLSGMTHNMSLNALADIVSLASKQSVAASDIADAVQSFRVGDINMESPWRGEQLRQKIIAAEEGAIISRRVKGQTNAVNMVLDILKRTSIGLTGAQAPSSSSRPRGVLFFVGPTGVGKTEMAKTIAEIVFGDSSAYLRFDMSEFSAEHSADRLIGAPPGYVGFDQGGELTNAMRERPFRVVLFDEIEKAHHRILDKFLQILEDGRLTDGRGETVFFSDALIVFTSNLGISRELPNGEVEMLVTPDDSPEKFSSSIMRGVQDHFRRRLQRPEILNRMGENIVIFNFIPPDVAKEILSDMIENVKSRLRDEHKVELSFSIAAQQRLHDLCCAKENLINGGRGIGSKLEAVLVNPLARLMFSLRPKSGSKLEIGSIQDAHGIISLIPT